MTDYVVGEVGFGSNIGGEDAGRIAELEAELAEKQRQVNMLRRALKRCAALGWDIAAGKHEALLKTAPK